jgi:hypothetical protein
MAMKARRLSEVRKLVQTPEFRAWCEATRRACEEVSLAQGRREALLAQAARQAFESEGAQRAAEQALDRAGDLEDAAAGMLAEAMELENQGLALVAAFEEQRFRASEAWMAACAAERRLEALREARAANPTARSDAEIARAERQHARAQREDARQREARDRLWDEVERHWARSMELSLRLSELKVQAARLRETAERRLREGEQLRAQAEALRAQSEGEGRALAALQAQLSALLRSAVEQFGATPGESFLYFRQREDARRAWCVALNEDRHGYNIEVQPGAVYACEAKRGVELLEPALEARVSPEGESGRFELYWLEGRKGRPPARAREPADESAVEAGRRAG